jgi:hypothetical protein
MVTPTGVEFPPQPDKTASAQTARAGAPNFKSWLPISSTLSAEFITRWNLSSASSAVASLYLYFCQLNRSHL